MSAGNERQTNNAGRTTQVPISDEKCDFNQLEVCGNDSGLWMVHISQMFLVATRLTGHKNKTLNLLIHHFIEETSGYTGACGKTLSPYK